MAIGNPFGKSRKEVGVSGTELTFDPVPRYYCCTSNPTLSFLSPRNSRLRSL